jgi:hypothetical protein
LRTADEKEGTPLSMFLLSFSHYAVWNLKLHPPSSDDLQDQNHHGDDQQNVDQTTSVGETKPKRP